MDVRTFDEVADQQGWNEQTLVFLLRQFVAEHRLYEELDQFARTRAAEENTSAARTAERSE